jgi:hypothetical protein
MNYACIVVVVEEGTTYSSTLPVYLEGIKRIRNFKYMYCGHVFRRGRTNIVF